MEGLLFDLAAALADLEGTGSCLILTHNNPDPDSIASALGLRVLLEASTSLQVTIGYGGTIGRAENRALVTNLCIPMTPVRPAELARYDRLALVDTQPGAGNNMVPSGRLVDIVVDHHPAIAWTPPSPWCDLRADVGATTSIVYGYLRARGVPVTTELATAFVYGIVSDTMDLGRGATDAEFTAYVELLPRCALETLGRIRQPALPLQYYKTLNDALEHARVYGSRLVTLALDEVPYPDLPAELADFLVRAEGIEFSFCSGRYQERLHVSLRTPPGGDADANVLIRQVVEGLGVAGGHEYMAGGFIDFEPQYDAQQTGQVLAARLAALLDLPGDPVPMLSQGGWPKTAERL